MVPEEEQGVSPTIKRQVRDLQQELYSLRVSVHGNPEWNLPSLSARLTSSEQKLLGRIESMETRVDSIKTIQDAWIWEKEREKQEQEKKERLEKQALAKKEKFRNIVLTSVLGMFGSALAGILVLLFQIMSGVNP